MKSFNDGNDVTQLKKEKSTISLALTENEKLQTCLADKITMSS